MSDRMYTEIRVEPRKLQGRQTVIAVDVMRVKLRETTTGGVSYMMFYGIEQILEEYIFDKPKRKTSKEVKTICAQLRNKHGLYHSND